jgi:hypothetical protein
MTLEAEIDRKELKKVKIRPLSFLMGVMIGCFDAKIPPQGGGLNKLISQDPSLLQYALFGGLTSAIIYTDNIKGGRTKRNSLLNSGICFGNYTVGYTLGYIFSKAF